MTSELELPIFGSWNVRALPEWIQKSLPKCAEDGRICGALADRGYICNLPEGHFGPHVAWGSDYVVAIWENEREEKGDA